MDRGAWWAVVLGVTKQLDVAEHSHTHTQFISTFSKWEVGV